MVVQTGLRDGTKWGGQWIIDHPWRSMVLAPMDHTVSLPAHVAELIMKYCNLSLNSPLHGIKDEKLISDISDLPNVFYPAPPERWKALVMDWLTEGVAYNGSIQDTGPYKPQKPEGQKIAALINEFVGFFKNPVYLSNEEFVDGKEYNICGNFSLNVFSGLFLIHDQKLLGIFMLTDSD